MGHNMKRIKINNTEHIIKNRVIWAFNPITRVIQSKKNYKRTNNKSISKKEYILNNY